MIDTMKALVLWQPWPTLIRLGVKRFETRGAPLAGPMCPPGIRPVSGFAVERGERVAIVSAKRKLTEKLVVGDFEAWPADPKGRIHPNHKTERPARIYQNNCRLLARGTWAPLPEGEVICTARVVDALEVKAPGVVASPPYIRPTEVPACVRGLFLRPAGDDGYPVDITDQLPYGDWDPGRWGMELDDVEVVPGGTVPVQTRGNRQGVFEIEVTW